MDAKETADIIADLNDLPPWVRMMVEALVKIRDKAWNGSGKEFDRESYIYHLWSESDHEIFEWCEEALHAAGIGSIKNRLG